MLSTQVDFTVKETTMRTEANSNCFGINSEIRIRCLSLWKLYIFGRFDFFGVFKVQSQTMCVLRKERKQIEQSCCFSLRTGEDEQLCQVKAND